MIKNSNKRAHIKQIYKSLNLSTIDQILTLELQKFSHKLNHNNLPMPISKGTEKNW